MADRYTRKNAEAAFAGLAAAMGKTIGPKWDSPAGTWALDHNAAYGGYVIHEHTRGHDGGAGGVGCPMGHTRRNAREFYEVCWFAVSAIDQAERRLQGVMS